MENTFIQTLLHEYMKHYELVMQILNLYILHNIFSYICLNTNKTI